MGYSLCSGDIVEIYLKLHNQPSKAIPEGTKIGSVTIEITEGFGSLRSPVLYRCERESDGQTQYGVIRVTSPDFPSEK